SSSRARFFADLISHAPGLSGMPVAGHRSRAVSSASCARSSAKPMSRTTRARPPISRADSIRQTASMARRVASGASLTRASRALALEIRPQPLLLRAQLGRHRLAEVLRLEDGAHLDLGASVE